MTPVSGTVVRAEVSTADFPFAHPFGFDYDFYAVLDPEFNGLLAAKNTPSPSECQTGKAEKEYCEAAEEARDKGIAGAGILGFEIDERLLHQSYRPHAGDRVAAHGTWIVDCGHPDYHAEIHPPLLVAKASIDKERDQLRGTIIGRPYAVSQRYRPDNTPFIPHALGQLVKVGLSPAPISLSAEPNITGVPFRGALLAHYTFALPPTATSAYRDATVQYHFVHRPGIAVSVMQPTKHTADVAIFLDEDQYVEASAPSCTTKRYTPEQVDDAAGWSRGTLREIALAVPVASPGVLDFLG